MTELPEILSTQRFKEVSISNNFQSTSPAAAFGIDWESTSALTLGVFGGIAPDGTEKADTTLTLSGSATNYVEMTTAGVVSSNTSAYTAGRVKLFRIATNANGITSYTDDRSFSPGGLSTLGPTSSTDNAVARWDGTTGKVLQNSVVTISDLGVVAGVTSLTIAQGTITDPANALTITSTWNDAADTFVAASIDVTDTASAAASLLQRWRVGGTEKASIRKDGTLTITGGTFILTGTYTATGNEWAKIDGTFAGSNTASQAGWLINPTFTLTGGATTSVYGMRSNPRLGTTSNNVTILFGQSSRVFTESGYSGTVAEARAISAEAPSIDGTNPITAYAHYQGAAVANGNGITSGTVTNYGTRILAFTAAAGAGGTVVNYGHHLTLASGSAAGNTNYGLRITGNGGAASTNWALHIDSTANNAFAGNVRIGSTSAPTVALDVTGAAAISTNLNVTGVSGLGVASSSTTALIVPASTTGVSSLRVPHGAAPSAPVNGDIWTTTAGMFVRINGATVGPLT